MIARTALCTGATIRDPANASAPSTALGDNVRMDRTRYDGLAEKCTYTATRRSATNEGLAVLEHLWSEIESPIGPLNTHELALVPVVEKGVVEAQHSSYAAESKPQHWDAVLPYEGPSGVTYLVQSHERSACWKRD